MDNNREAFVNERLSTLETSVTQLQQAVERLNVLVIPASHPSDARLQAEEVQQEPGSYEWLTRPYASGPSTPIAPPNEAPTDTYEGSALPESGPAQDPLAVQPQTQLVSPLDNMPEPGAHEVGESNEQTPALTPQQASPEPALVPAYRSPRQPRQRPTPSTPSTPSIPSIPSIPTLPRASHAASGPRSLLSVVCSAEYLLNKVGIALFLFGVVFLFKYTVDRNLLSEQGRIGLGLILGTILLFAGLTLHGKRRRFSQVLLGGSIATYYITGYASYQFFPDLRAPYELAFGFMALITLIAFALSARQDEPVLALIGLTGGLLTPFALNSPQLSLPWLVSYTCLLLACASAVYLFRGWRSLLWSSLNGACSILLFGYYDKLLWHPDAALGDRWSLQAGAAFVLFAFWAMPTLREVLSSRDPQNWPRPEVSFIKNQSIKRFLDFHVYPLVVAIPPAVLAFSVILWPDLVSAQTWGWIEVAGAVLFAFASWVIWRSAPGALGKLAYTHALVAVSLLTIGLLSLLEGNALLFALALEGAALHLIAHRFSDRGSANFGHVLFGMVGLGLIDRLVPHSGEPASQAIVNWRSLTDLAVLGLGLAASLLMKSRKAATVYQSCIHVALLAWFWRELHVLPNGEGLVMLAWGAYGLLLHIVSRKVQDRLSSISVSAAAHLAFEGAIGLLALRLVTPYQGDRPLVNEKAVIDLAFMALALAASFIVQSRTGAAAYRILVHAAALGWLWREATMVDQGHGYVMVRWAAYLTMLALISSRVSDRVTLKFVSVAYLGVALLFAQRFISGHEGSLIILNAKTAGDLGVIALAFVASFVAQPREMPTLYRLVAHAAVLSLLWREFSSLPGQPGLSYVMLSWAIYLTALHVVSYRLQDRVTSMAAHVPFVAVAGLFLVSIATGPETGIAVFNQKALIDLAVIALAVACSLVAWPKEAGMWYRYAVHGAALAWLWRELYQLPRGYEYVMLAWAAYAVLLHLVSRLIARRWGCDNLTVVAAHSIFAASGLWLLGRIAWGLYFVNEDELAVFNPRGLANLGIIALAAGAYMLLRASQPRRVMLAYGVWLHVAFLGWLWQELGLIPHGGNGYVTIAWGAYAIILVVLSLRGRRSQELLYCGIATLFAVAAKLFLIDLRYLDAIWRILLFLGFGGLFLILSYYFQSVVKRVSEGSTQQESTQGL